MASKQRETEQEKKLAEIFDSPQDISGNTSELEPLQQIKASTRAIMAVSPDDLLETNLQTEVESENAIKSVSKELFNRGNIDLKSEVSHNEVNHISKIRFLDTTFGVKNMDSVIDSFLSLRVSLQRKSRHEFIDALQTERRNATGGNWVQRMFQRGGNNGNNNNGN